uniref:Glycosyltransferase n=1 Tax=Leersia perrieri TaxID=77586 RepID=A0A0D9WMR5_9ORYZ
MAAAAHAAVERVGGNSGAAVAGRDHVVVFPFMAKGHMIPLLHFAAALASRHGSELRVTVVTTPANLAFARRRLPPSVDVSTLPFPPHPEIPPGVESTDALPSESLFPSFLRATASLRDPFAKLMSSLADSSSPSPPLALVSDFFLGFTQRVADGAGVRRVTFHGMSAFSLALCFTLSTSRPHDAAAAGGGEEAFRVPGFPEEVTITANEVPHAVTQGADADDPVTKFLNDEVLGWDYRSWGVLVNSFAALDGDYAGILESLYLPGARAWLVGPLFLAAGDDNSPPVTNQEDDGDDEEGCIRWLDERAPGSVVYVSFGTQARLAATQLDELAHGLVESGHAFLWAVGRAEWSPPVDAGPYGKIVRGWAPQRRVLAHTAVGAFLTHCGWNSVLESLAAGKPMVAWPVMAEQAANAKLVADIVGAGVRVRVDRRTNGGGGGIVGRAQVAEKVRRVMDGGEEGRTMRAKAEEVRRAAIAAVAEGGTSTAALRRLVDELRSSYDDDDVAVAGGDRTTTAVAPANGANGKR